MFEDTEATETFEGDTCSDCGAEDSLIEVFYGEDDKYSMFICGECER